MPPTHFTPLTIGVCMCLCVHGISTTIRYPCDIRCSNLMLCRMKSYSATIPTCSFQPAPHFHGHKLCSNNKAIAAAAGIAHLGGWHSQIAAVWSNAEEEKPHSAFLLYVWVPVDQRSDLCYNHAPFSLLINVSYVPRHGASAVSGSSKHLHNVIIFTRHRNITSPFAVECAASSDDSRS